MSNITHLAAKKYQDDQDKQDALVDQVVAALDKEEANYRQMRMTLKKSIRRKTMQRKDLTSDQLEKLQKMDEDYQLFKVTDSNLGSHLEYIDKQEINQDIQNNV